MTVSDLLAQSRAAHLAYRMALPRRTANGQVIPGNATEAAARLADAYALRAEAELADLEGADPAWTAYQRVFPHYQLLGFYADKDAQIAAQGPSVLIRETPAVLEHLPAEPQMVTITDV